MTSEGTQAWPEGPIHDVVVRPVKFHSDSRGWLAEIFRSDEIDPGILPAMGYISATHPDVVRGPHEHVGQTDMFVFMGPGTFRFRAWDNRPLSPTYRHCVTLHVGAENTVIVVVPPGVVHGYRNISTVDAWSLNFPNRLFNKKGRPDEIRHENMEESPFNL